MHFRVVVIFLLMVFFSSKSANSQEVYNACDNALEICPNNTYSISNIGATSTVCPNCEDDFATCFVSNNSIWLTFTTNAAGGNVQVDFSNLVFETGAGQDNEMQATIFEAAAPCDGSTYTQLGNCASNETGNFSLNAAGLTANTTYYIVIDGDLNGAGITAAAECTMDVQISGSSVDRPLSTITIDTPANPVCLQETISFSAQVTDCPDTGNYIWYINGAPVATTIDPSFQTSNLLNGDVVTVETTCYTLCVDTVQSAGITMGVLSFPIYAGPDQVITPGETTTLNGSTSASSYQWTPTFLVSDPTNLQAIVSPTTTTVFTLTATDGFCTLTDQLTITVESEVVIPNTFSPNNDQVNDTWVILGLEEYPNTQVSIFDRWGQEVYQTTNYTPQKSWNGSSKRGQDLRSGVYFYIVRLNDTENQEFSGSVTLIR